MKTKCLCIIVLLMLPIPVGAQSPLVSQKIDEFGVTNCEDWMARSENLAAKLRGDESSLGYLVYYGGRINIPPYSSTYTKKLPGRGEAFARAAAIKSRLINTLGLNGNRIILLNGGYRENWTVELWVVPKGVLPPVPTPTLKESELRFRNGNTRKQEYTCWEI